ncbi:unnamed protein product [Durusdinium trenchii]|uniref:Uncharacterized protein n=2 Tax=Durusdinium trenchii TaxID=1381693 RepID=A0ABP0J512_9DINO
MARLATLGLAIVACATTCAGGASRDARDFLGSCGVLVPQPFTCRGMPEWAAFLEATTENRAKGFQTDDALLGQAQWILQQWQDKPYPPQDFFKYLCSGPETPWPLADRFCLWGFVAALIVQSRHLMGSAEREDQKSADMDFGYATTVLGKEGSMDFLDSSPWPFSIIDAFININETNFMSYEAYAIQQPVTPPSVPLKSLHWQPPVELEKTQLPKKIRLAVVGSHATLSLEPVEMLRRFLSGVQVAPVFYGLEARWCQILGMCDQGTEALGKLFKDAEKDPYAYSWEIMSSQVDQIYQADRGLREAELILCTEPLAGCLMMLDSARARNRRLPLLGYLGVALLNNCPPDDMDLFWERLVALLEPKRPGQPAAQMAVNNLILSEQIYYQTGYRMPYVRAHGLYTNMGYAPTKPEEILIWRAPLFSYVTTRCAMMHFSVANPQLRMKFHFMEEDEHLSYSQVGSFKAVALIPWDHALMTFYELYTATIPLLMPGTEWMYRLLYQRGQLSVGERIYQTTMPGYTVPVARFADQEPASQAPGASSPAGGLGSAKAARGVAEDVLTRGLEAQDLDTAKQYLKAALELIQDMQYFLAVAENRTDEDSYTSMGVIRRSASSKTSAFVPQRAQPKHPEPWHPYTPFQMSPLDSNDWTRMRKGTWWLRRGVRFDAMRYWYQYSDFARFPGITYFSNLPDLMCMAESLDINDLSVQMRRYNEQSLVHSVTFWTYSVATLLG